MANLPKAAAGSTRDLTIGVLLDRIQSNFKLLRDGSVDEAVLKHDLEDLSESLKEVGQDMQKEYTWLKEFLPNVRTEERKAAFLASVQRDREVFETTREKLLASETLVRETEDIVEVVYKITSSRSALGKLKSPSDQRAMSQSLAKISIAQEKVFEGRKGLIELLDEIGRRGIRKHLTSPDPVEPNDRTSAAQATGRSVVKEKPRREPKPKPKSKSKPKPKPKPPAGAKSRGQSTVEPREPKVDAREPRAEEPSTSEVEARQKSRVDARPQPPDDSRSDSALKHVGLRGEAATRSDTRRPEARDPTRDSRTAAPPQPSEASEPAVPRSKSESLKQAVDTWATWNPLAPLGLSDSIRIINAAREEAVVIRVQSLVAQRRWNSELSRTQAASRRAKSGSMWDLPASPPPQYSGAVEESDYCETAYRPETLEHVLYAGDVPPDLLRRVTGKVLLQEEFSAWHAGVVRPHLEKRCLKALSRWTIDGDLLHDHYHLDASIDDESAVASSVRFVRSLVDVEAIPILHLKCELGIDRGQACLIDAWLYGQQDRLYLGDVPRAWTWKTTAWVAGIAVLGIPLGYLLSAVF